jgi:cardiolipin synthase
VFVEEYLEELRRERFTPGAFARYSQRVAARIRENVVANPGAVRSVWSVALLYFALAFVAAAGLAMNDDRLLAKDLFLATAAGILPAFVLVTMHLEFLRDRDGFRLSAINLPTALTLLRVTLVPGIVLFLAERRFALALGCYAVAASTDILDGWIARRSKQVTQLGTVLDPIVDIVFNLAVLGGLLAAGLLPAWVFAVACLRYGILLVGGACLYLFVGPVRVQSTFFGRFTGVVMTALVGFLVLLHVARGPLALRLLTLTEWALGLLLAATVVQVVALGWYNLKVMRHPESVPGRVVGDVRWGRP